jgi:death-on-curing protein
MSEPLWVHERDALALHARILALDGGPAGVRDPGLLEGALARARQLHAYSKTIDIPGMAAAYIVGIVRNHPFLDGNKRTGFIVGVLFLEINGYRFAASEEGAAQSVLSLAAGTFDENAIAAWMRANVKRQ